MVSSKPPFLLLCAIARLTTTTITLTPLANVLVSLQHIGLLSFSHNTPATQAPGCARHTRRRYDAFRLSSAWAPNCGGLRRLEAGERRRRHRPGCLWWPTQ